VALAVNLSAEIIGLIVQKIAILLVMDVAILVFAIEPPAGSLILILSNAEEFVEILLSMTEKIATTLLHHLAWNASVH